MSLALGAGTAAAGFRTRQPSATSCLFSLPDPAVVHLTTAIAGARRSSTSASSTIASPRPTRTTADPWSPRHRARALSVATTPIRTSRSSSSSSTGAGEPRRWAEEASSTSTPTATAAAAKEEIAAFRDQAALQAEEEHGTSSLLHLFPVARDLGLDLAALTTAPLGVAVPAVVPIMVAMMDRLTGKYAPTTTVIA